MTRLLGLVAIFLLSASAVLVVEASLARPPRVIPYGADLPAGGSLVYQAADSEYGWNGYPVRIVSVGGLCVTETYQSGSSGNEAWVFRMSGKCAP